MAANMTVPLEDLTTDFEHCLEVWHEHGCAPPPRRTTDTPPPHSHASPAGFIVDDLVEPELLDRLAEQVIIGAKVGCDYEIPPPPAGETLDPGAVNVVYSNPSQSLTFPRVPDGASCGNNMAWTYDNPASPTRVELCPAACDVVEVDAEAVVDVLFGCETVLLI